MNRKERLTAPPDFHSAWTPARRRRWTLAVIVIGLAVSIVNQVYADEIGQIVDGDTSLTEIIQE